MGKFASRQPRAVKWTGPDHEQKTRRSNGQGTASELLRSRLAAGAGIQMPADWTWARRSMGDSLSKRIHELRLGGRGQRSSQLTWGVSHLTCGVLAAASVLAGTLCTAVPGWAQAPRYQSPYAAAPAAATVALPAPAAISPGGSVVENVVARINDQIISRSDVERSEQQLVQELNQNNASPADREQRQKDLLRDLIDQQLLLSRAKELGLNADAEVVRRLDEIRKQNHLDTMEDLEKAARQQGVSFEDFKAQIRNNVLTQQVVRDEVGQRLRLNPAEEQSYYEAHKSEFEQPEQVRLSEILVPTPENATDAQVTAAKEKADLIDAKVKAGGDFEALAKEYSGGPTAKQGGDLGVFKRGGLAKVLEDATFSLPAGQITAPIRTKQGFILLKVTDHQQAGVAPLKQVEPQVQEAMYMQEMQPALRAYLTKLREDASIEIEPGYVDSGASAKETRPVFTAYAAPVPKKKAAEKRRYEGSGRLSQAKAAPAASGFKAGAAGADSATTVAAAPAVFGKSRTSARPVSAKQRRGKIRREKIRYGQAPRNALPPGPEQTASGAGAGPSLSSPSGEAAAPGLAIAPDQTSTQISSTSDPDPLAPKPVETGKTRFSARAPEVKAEKVKAKQAVIDEKKAATPEGPTPDELAAQKVQAAPLGLNGDTGKKKKKKRTKGVAKDRIQDRQAPAPPPPVSPTVNPDLGKSLPGTAPTSDRTTIPPVSAPPPGVNSTGQPLPPSGVPQTTPYGTPQPPTTPPAAPTNTPPTPQ